MLGLIAIAVKDMLLGAGGRGHRRPRDHLCISSSGGRGLWLPVTPPSGAASTLPGPRPATAQGGRDPSPGGYMRAGVTGRHPPDRDPGQRRHDPADVDRAAERHTAGPAHVRAVEDHGARGDEYLVGDPAASQM